MKRRLALWTLALWLCWRSPLRADEAEAKGRFEQGVQAAAAARWEEALGAFEASLAQADRPATRFNLLLANDALGRPLEMVRHASAFLAQANADRPAEIARALSLRARAIAQLAVLRVDSLTEVASFMVDGAQAAYLIDGRIYLMPGLHRLEAQLHGGASEALEIALEAGEQLAWPRVIAPAPERAPRAIAEPAQVARAAEPPAMPLPGAREPIAPSKLRAAWTLGALSAALVGAALGSYGAALRQANELERAGFESAGYPSAADRYVSVSRAVYPLAFAGGAAAFSALMARAPLPQRGAQAWSIASLIASGALLGLGTALLVREPALLIEDTDLYRPSRQAGSLLIAAGLPLASYGIASQLGRGSERHVRLHSLLPVRGAW